MSATSAPDPVDRSPARVSATFAIGAAAAAVVAVAAGNPTAGALGALGVLGVLVGVTAGSRRAVSLGAFGLLLGVLAAGVRGATPEPLLVGTAATVLAWDFGEQAINVGEQLGRTARTRRAEVSHAAASLGVGGVGVAIGYGVYLVSTGGQPLAALAFLLIAGIAFLFALRG